jgi:putative hydrolase of the HAD superfamily
MIRGVIFDLGGTAIRLTRPWQDVVEESQPALVEQLLQEGVNLDAAAFAAEFRQAMESNYHNREMAFLETTTATVLRTVLSRFGVTDVPEESVQRALARLYTMTERQWEAMPGIYNVLGELRQMGYRLSIVSNAGDDANVQRLLDRCSLRSYFDPILVSAAVGLRKPNPAVFLMVLQAWQIQPREAVMIGDTLAADILGAQNAGLHQIWLTAEADTPANRAHAGAILPEATARSLYELPELIARLGATEAQLGRHA